MFSWFEVWFSDGSPNMKKAGTFTTEADAINAANIYKNAIVEKLTKVVLKFADGWTDVEQVYTTGE